MPTAITHSVIGASAACCFSSEKKSLKFRILSIVCPVLPDADVIGYLWLHIPYHHFLGHRGFFHSPFFAAMLSIFIVSVFYRKEPAFSKRRWKYALYFFLITASHGLADVFTNGGRGVALLSPFTSARYFFPWTPIEVSPLRIKAFLSQRGLTVLINELLWIWTPSFFIVIFLKIKRNKPKYPALDRKGVIDHK